MPRDRAAKVAKAVIVAMIARLPAWAWAPATVAVRAIWQGFARA